MPGRALRRYKTVGNGDTRPAFHGKLPEEFNERDMLAFAADTDLLLFQKVSEETLAAIHAAGYDYQGGAVIPRPGKEETDMNGQETAIPAQKETKEALPLKLDVSVRAIQPMGNLLGFASVKFNDCFVVEDFKILQTDKGLYVGMPSKPDKTSRTGYRDTAKPITDKQGGQYCQRLYIQMQHHTNLIRVLLPYAPVVTKPCIVYPRLNLIVPQALIKLVYVFRHG